MAKLQTRPSMVAVLEAARQRRSTDMLLPRTKPAENLQDYQWDDSHMSPQDKATLYTRNCPAMPPSPSDGPTALQEMNRPAKSPHRTATELVEMVEEASENGGYDRSASGDDYIEIRPDGNEKAWPASQQQQRRVDAVAEIQEQSGSEEEEDEENDEAAAGPRAFDGRPKAHGA